ncbi:CDP-glucose 4,6-dehydratase, partial [uncultured Brachyspira sp.]
MENLEMNNIFDLFKNKKVLITGHTGFKGSWLSEFLNNIGSDVYGIGLEPEKLSLYNLIDLKTKVKSYIQDIRDLEKIKNIVKEINPDIIFHLAAQPIVLESYNDPVYTYETNILGTLNILESIKVLDNLQCAVMITTDKVYENKEWAWGYRENDILGGDDPYSSSKACAELIIKSYKKSFFNDKNIGIARAGNVIGGGDFSKYRIIPDIVRAIEKNEPVELRNPNSVRPWQHVLDVLYGYLLFAYNLINNKHNIHYSYNLAPIYNGDEYTVEYITKTFIKIIGKGMYNIKSQNFHNKENNLLLLDSSLVRKELKWKELFSIDNAIKETANWYREYLNNTSLSDITSLQIEKYKQSRAEQSRAEQSRAEQS